jgi:hypothetical protein
MDLNNEIFVAGAIAAVRTPFEVDSIVSGSMESVVFEWYRIYDEQTGDCVIVLVEQDGSITSIDPCSADDQEDFTGSLLKSLNFRADTEEVDSVSWFCILADGWVNARWVNESMLRTTLEAGAAQLNTEFNFDEWALKAGFSRISETIQENPND